MHKLKPKQIHNSHQVRQEFSSRVQLWNTCGWCMLSSSMFILYTFSILRCYWWLLMKICRILTYHLYRANLDNVVSEVASLCQKERPGPVGDQDEGVKRLFGGWHHRSSSFPFAPNFLSLHLLRTSALCIDNGS